MAPFSKATPREPRLLRMFGLYSDNMHANFLQPAIKIAPARFALARFNHHCGFEQTCSRNQSDRVSCDQTLKNRCFRFIERNGDHNGCVDHH